MGLWSLIDRAYADSEIARRLDFIRILLGMGEAGTLPAINAMLARWFPPREYSRAAAFCWSGGYAGSIVAFPLASGNPRYVGVAGDLLLLFCSRHCFGFPRGYWARPTARKTQKVFPKDELSYLAQERPSLQPVEAVPWNRLLRLRPLWAAWALHFSSNWFTYVMVTWLPTYLTVERNFSLANMAVGASLPFVSALIGSNLFGSLIDRMTRGRDRTYVRKLFMIPYVFSALTLLMVPLATSPTATVACFAWRCSC